MHSILKLEEVILTGRRRNFAEVVLLLRIFEKENKPKALESGSGVSD